MGAGIEVAAGSMSLIVSDQAVAAWPLERVDIEVETDGFHFVVDGEEFIFVTRDASAFAAAVGLLDRDSSPAGRTKTLKRSESRTQADVRTSSARAKKARVSKPRPEWIKRFRWELRNIDFSSRTTQLGVAVLVLAVLLGIFARPLLAFALMGTGSLGLLIGTGAMLDPIIATRLPTDLTAGQSVLISVVLLLAGMLVLVL
jgi:hypothetical protein